MNNKYFGIDFGGTNLRIGQVEADSGEIIGKIFSCPVENVSSNSKLINIILKNIPEERCNIGISAAGVLDEERKILLSAPNSRIKEEITFAKVLENLGYNVLITNDMKAASQGAAKYGEGRGFKNIAVMTYSSGLGGAIVRNGVNVTDAEIGHHVYDPHSDLFCGCGETGHLEIYASGNGAATRARQFFDITHIINHPIIKYALEDYNKLNTQRIIFMEELKNPETQTKVFASVKAKHIYKAFREEPTMEPQASIREKQIKAIVYSFGTIVSFYNPINRIILMGSNAEKEVDTLIKPAVDIYNNSGGKYQHGKLEKPGVVITQMPEIGVQGAVAYFINQKKY